MTYKINGTEVIDNAGAVVNFLNLDSTFINLYPNVLTLGSGQSVIDCNYSLVIVEPNVDNYPYSVSNLSLGVILQIIVDRGADGAAGNDPSFPSSAFIWSTAGEPTWSNHRYWMINAVGAAPVGTETSVKLRAAATGFDVPAAGSNYIPTQSSDYIGREYSTSGQQVAYSFDTDTATDGGTATAFADLDFDYTGNPSTNKFTLTVTNAAGTGTWYTAAGGSQSLALNTPVTIFEKSGITPTAIRVVYGPTSDPTLIDLGWTATTTTQTENVGVSATASVGGVGTDNATNGRVITIYGRASGYDDTNFGSFYMYVSASAESTCFTGESLLFLLDSSDQIKAVKMEDAYEAYLAAKATSQSIDMIVLGVDGYFNEILDFRKIIGRRELYGINGEENFVTGGHPFLTTYGWKCMDVELGRRIRPDLELEQLLVGDVLIKVDPTTQEKYQERIESITSNTQPACVYSLDVAGPDSETNGNDTYIVNGYVVHNK